MSGFGGDNPVCKVTPVILHGIVSPDSGDSSPDSWNTTPCRMTLHGVARYLNAGAAAEVEDSGHARGGAQRVLH